MPYKRKTAKKRPYRKKRYGRRRAPRTVVQRGLGPIAPRQIVRLKYSENISRTLTSTITSDYVYNMNSIFDPNLSGTGHQPLGRDQWGQFYRNYRVFGFSYNISIAPSSDICRYTIVPNRNSGAFIIHDEAAEQPRGMTKYVGFQGGTATNIRGHYSLPQIAGVSTSQYKADQNYQASMGSNPVEELCLHIVTTAPATSLTTRFSINLIFHCELIEPVDLTQS